MGIDASICLVLYYRKKSGNFCFTISSKLICDIKTKIKNDNEFLKWPICIIKGWNIKYRSFTTYRTVSLKTIYDNLFLIKTLKYYFQLEIFKHWNILSNNSIKLRKSYKIAPRTFH